MNFKVGDGVMFYPALGDEPEISVVTEVRPEGIPSYPKPMLKLEGRAGYVAAAFCKLTCENAAPDLQSSEDSQS